MPKATESAEKGKTTLQDVLSLIEKEQPSYWPNGLNTGLYNGSGDNLTALTDKEGNVVGFLGWQERGGTGYYSVGLLPEYRKKGIASRLLPDYIKEMNTRNLPVKATIDKDNAPSLALADKLGVKVILT